MPYNLLRGSASIAGITRLIVMSPIPITSQLSIHGHSTMRHEVAGFLRYPLRPEIAGTPDEHGGRLLFRRRRSVQLGPGAGRNRRGDEGARGEGLRNPGESRIGGPGFGILRTVRVS